MEAMNEGRYDNVNNPHVVAHSKQTVTLLVQALKMLPRRICEFSH